MEALGSFRLIPVAFLQHVYDDVPLAVFHDIEQGGVSAMFQQRERRATPGDLIGKQFGPDLEPRRKHHGTFYHVLQFADVARPRVR